MFDISIEPTLMCKIVTCLPWSLVAFDAVDASHAYSFIVERIVKCHREWQDVLDLNFIAQQHVGTDLDTTVWTTTVSNVVAQLFP